MFRHSLLRALFLFSFVGVSYVNSTIPARAASYYSFTGNFAAGTDVQNFFFTLDDPLSDREPMSFRTWQYGAGGTNAAGIIIPGSGFDPVLTLYDGANSIIAYDDDISRAIPADYNALIDRNSAAYPGEIALPATLPTGNYSASLSTPYSFNPAVPHWAVDIKGPNTGIYMTGASAVGGSTLGSLYLGSDGGYFAPFDLNNGQTLSFTDNLVIGQTGAGYFTVNNGNLQSAALRLANQDYSTGFLFLQGETSVLSTTGEVIIGNQGFGRIYIQNGAGADSTSSTPISLGAQAGSEGNVDISGVSAGNVRSRWTTNQSLVVGQLGRGWLGIQYGAHVSSPGGMIAASSALTPSAIHLGLSMNGFDAEWDVSGNVYVGGSDTAAGGTGYLEVWGGGRATLPDYTLKIWNTGTVQLAGGTITAKSLINSGGTFTHTDGTLEIRGGTFDPGTADYSINGASSTDYPIIQLFNGATFTLTGRLDLGRNQYGELNAFSNSHVTTSLASIGVYAGDSTIGKASVAGSNSIWTVNGTQPDGKVMWIGDDDIGLLDIYNQGKVELTGAYSRAIIGNTSTGWGVVQVEGSGSRFESRQDILVGNSGHGTLRIYNGGAVVANFLDPSYYPTAVGEYPNSQGEVFIDGIASDGSRSQWIRRSYLLVGFLGRGTVNITNGALLNSQGGVITLYNSSAGSSVTVEGTGPAPDYLPAEWSSTNSIEVGGIESYPGGLGTLTVKQGGWVNISPAYVGYDKLKIWPAGKVELLGGRITTGSLINSGGTFTHTDGTLEVNGGTFDPGVTNYVLDGGSVFDFPTVTLMNGATANISGNIIVGNVYHGGMDILGGSQVSCTLADIGNEATSTFGSTVSVSGQNSLWTIKEVLNLAAWGNGSLYLLDHGKVELTDPVYGALQIGIGGDADGSLSVDGKGSQFSCMAGVGIGFNGTGIIQIQNGGEIIDKSSFGGRIGVWQLGYGQVIVTGTAAPDDDTPSQWKTAGPIYVGNEGRGELTILGGALVESNGGAISYYASAADSWALISGASAMGTPSRWNITNSLYVGGNESDFGGAGTLTVGQGGLLNINPGKTLKIWTSSTVNLIGGQISTGSLINSGGVFNHTDGILEVNGGLFNPRVTNYVLDGAAADDLPTVSLLNGATANFSGDMTVGNAQQGSMEIFGGSQISCANAYIGREATSNLGSSIYLTGDNSRLTVNGDDLTVGWNGLGIMSINNGASVSCKGAFVGFNPTAAGSGVSIVGAGTTIPQATWTVAGQLIIGDPAGGGNSESVEVFIGPDGLLKVGTEISVHASGLLYFEDGTIQSDHIALYGGKLSGGGNIDDLLYSQNGTVDVPTQGSILSLHDSVVIFANSFLQKTGPGNLLLEGAQTWYGNSAFVASDGFTQYSCLAPSNLETSVASLAISDGGLVQVVSMYDPFTDQTDPQKHVAVYNDGVFEIYDEGATIAIALVRGDGDAYVHANAQLEAGLIVQDELTIGSGAEVVIRPISGGPLASGVGIKSVPEPPAFLLLLLALLTFCMSKSKLNVLLRAICSISLAGVLSVSSTIPARAATYYCFTGAFSANTDVQQFSFRLDDPLTSGEPMSFHTLQWGTGRINAAGWYIPGYGFDPVLKLFDTDDPLKPIALDDDISREDPPGYDYNTLIDRNSAAYAGEIALPGRLSTGEYRLGLTCYDGFNPDEPHWAVDIEGPDSGMYLTGASAVGSSLGSLWLESDNLSNEAFLSLPPGQSMTFTENIYVGLNGAGHLQLDNAAAQCNKMYIGGDWDDDGDGSGSVMVYGYNGHLNVTDSIVVGYEKKPSTTQFGGILSVYFGGLVENSSTWAIIGQLPNSYGLVEVYATNPDGTRSRWNSSAPIIVGQEGKGKLVIFDGGLVTSPGGSIAELASSMDSSVSLSGLDAFSNPAQWELTGNLKVGGSDSDPGGTGTLQVSTGGLVNVNSPYTIRIWNNGTVKLNGGQISTGSFINSGGTFNHTDGILEVNGGLFNPRMTNYVLDGAADDDLPTLKLLGGATENIGGEITVGNVHKGQLEIRGGSQFTCTDAYVGREADSYGLIMINGMAPDSTPSRLSTTGPIYVGYNGRGDLDIKNGAVVESRGGAIAYTDSVGGAGVFIGGSMGAYGQWNLTDTLYIGGSAAGPGGQGTLWVNLGYLNVSSGTVKVYPQGTIDIKGVVSAPLIELEGGTLTGDYLVYSSVISRNGVIDIDSGDYLEFTFAGLSIDNGYDLFKTGDGRLQLEHTMSWGAGSEFYAMDGTTKFMIASASVQPNASLIISEQGMVFAETEDPFTDNTNLNMHVDVYNSGYLQITNGIKQVGILTGNGDTNVQDGAELFADSLDQNELTINSGAEVVIRPILGGPTSFQTVPEPSMFLLAAIAMLCWSAARLKLARK